jgi:uncharacterized protein (DUF2141 family)
MIRSITALAVALMIAGPAFAAEPGATASVALTFETGVETGAVRVALYDSEAAYAGGAPVRTAIVDAAGGQPVARFADLPAGTYAARAFHDVDGDGRMNTNPFGMPTEPYAFSNNARGNMGPARWDAAQFAVSGATAQTISIR